MGKHLTLKTGKKIFELKLFHLESVCEDLGSFNTPLQLIFLILGHERGFTIFNFSFQTSVLFHDLNRWQPYYSALSMS